MFIPNFDPSCEWLGGTSLASRTVPEPSISRCSPGSASSVEDLSGGAAITRSTETTYGESAMKRRVPSGVEPLVALDRIAFLLELAGTRATRSRRSARRPTSIREIDPAELRELARAGPAARSSPGIGDTTARVVTEALAGKVPSYLERLELDAAEADDVERSGRRGPRLAARRPAPALGLVRRRSPDRARWPAPRPSSATSTSRSPTTRPGSRSRTASSPSGCASSSTSSTELNEELAPFRILTGIEVDILDDGALDQEDELLAELDVVVASVHSKLRMERGRDDRAHDRARSRTRTWTSSATAPVG